MTTNIGINKNIKSDIQRIVSTRKTQYTTMKDFVDHHLRIAIEKEKSKLGIS